MSQTQSHDYSKAHDFKDGSQKQGERTGELKENLSGLARSAESTVKAGVQEVTKSAGNTLDAGKKGAAKAIDGLTDRVSQSPLTTIGVALGVGVVVGFLVRRVIA